MKSSRQKIASHDYYGAILLVSIKIYEFTCAINSQVKAPKHETTHNSKRHKNHPNTKLHHTNTKVTKSTQLIT